jgi:hypothetical protein
VGARPTGGLVEETHLCSHVPVLGAPAAEKQSYIRRVAGVLLSPLSSALQCVAVVQAGTWASSGLLAGLKACQGRRLPTAASIEYILTYRNHVVEWHPHCTCSGSQATNQALHVATQERLLNFGTLCVLHAFQKFESCCSHEPTASMACVACHANFSRKKRNRRRFRIRMRGILIWFNAGA